MYNIKLTSYFEFISKEVTEAHISLDMRTFEYCPVRWSKKG